MAEAFYVIETTLNPGVQYNVGRAEMEHLYELGVLIGGQPAPAEVMDSQLADLINDVNSLVHAAIEAFPPGPHSHLSTEISDSGSTGRALLATTAALEARAVIGAGTASTKADVGLGSVDNTADTAKPVSAAQQAAIDAAKERANHTGTQTAATISDLREQVEDYVAALLGAGTNVTLTYTDNGTGAGSLTIAATGGTTDPEAVRDAIGIALVGAGLISVAVNDAGDTITISTTATANSTDAQLRDRSTHTGSQAISTVTGLQAALDAKAALTTVQTSQSGTAYTYVLADANTLVEHTNAAATAVTVPPNSSVPFPVGTSISGRAYAAGQVTVTPGAGVTLRSRGGALKSAGQYAEWTATKRATDEWVVTGDLTT